MSGYAIGLAVARKRELNKAGGRITDIKFQIQQLEAENQDLVSKLEAAQVQHDVDTAHAAGLLAEVRALAAESRNCPNSDRHPELKPLADDPDEPAFTGHYNKAFDQQMIELGYLNPSEYREKTSQEAAVIRAKEIDEQISDLSEKKNELDERLKATKGIEIAGQSKGLIKKTQVYFFEGHYYDSMELAEQAKTHIVQGLQKEISDLEGQRAALAVELKTLQGEEIDVLVDKVIENNRSAFDRLK